MGVLLGVVVGWGGEVVSVRVALVLFLCGGRWGATVFFLFSLFVNAVF